MVFASNDNSLSLDQVTNQFLVLVVIEPRSLIQPLKTLPIELT